MAHAGFLASCVHHSHAFRGCLLGAGLGLGGYLLFGYTVLRGTVLLRYINWRRARHPARRARAERSARGTEASCPHQLPLNWNFRTEERQKPTHLKEKPNKNCLAYKTQPNGDLSLAGLFRETGGSWGPHPRAPAPAPVACRLCIWLSCLRTCSTHVAITAHFPQWCS